MRNTDRDWQAIADIAPYYGVLANERFRQPTLEDLKDFFDSGEEELSYIIAETKRYFGTFEPSSALDFGCGVGRLLIPMARHTGYAVGIDVADRMLELARKHIADARVNAEVFTEIPDTVNFDWINSVMVFQHIPPRRGYDLLSRLWERLRSGGFLTLHITFFHDKSHMGEIQKDLEYYSYDGESVQNYSNETDETVGMRMYDYDLNRLLIILGAASAKTFHLETINHGGCHGIRLFTRKN